MEIFEIGTGYTSIPAKIGAATEIVVEELTTSMLKQGIDVNILDIKDSTRTASSLPIQEVYMPQFFSAADASLGIVHKFKRVLYSISLAMKLRKILKESSEKVILHFHNQYNIFFFLKLTPKALRDKAIIGYTIHSHVWFGDWKDIESTIKKRYFQEVFGCKNADKVFVLNDITTDMLTAHCGIDSNKITKIINGVNVDKYNATVITQQEKESILNKFGIIDKKIMFQVGSICERKNQLGTLQLLLPFLKQNRNIVFAFAGGIIDKTYFDSIYDFAEEEGVKEQIIYYGEVSPGHDLNILYSTAFATFMNSKSEAFALVMAESLSASTPVFINSSIISSLHFLKEKIGSGIIEINNSFNESMKQLLTDAEYYSDLQAKGRNFIINEYSWDKAAKEYIRILKS